MPLDDLTHDMITKRVMLVTLNISVFTGVRTDKNVTEKIAEENGTVAADTGKFAKQIVGKHSLEAINKVATAARTDHYMLTLPWSDVGQRLLSATGFLGYTSKLAKHQQDFGAAVDDFIAAYPQIIEQARARLNNLFDEADYPSAAEMRRRFEFDFRFMPMPTTNNWFVEGIEADMERMRSRVDEHVNRTVREAVRDVWQRVAQHATHVHEKLTNYEVDPETGKVVGSIFRDSLIENLRELTELLPSLNVTNDPELDDIALQLREITRFSAKALRADTGFRRDAAAKAKSVMEKAALILG